MNNSLAILIRRADYHFSAALCYQQQVMLVLAEREIQSLIDIEELIKTLEQAHLQYSAGKAVMPVRLVVILRQIQGRITGMPGFLGHR